MFCPQCGQERSSIETSFCSRCGFLLTGTADLLQTGGLIPRADAPAGFWAPSPRTRGIKQGLFIFLLSFLIVPLITVFSIMVSLRSPVLPILATLILVVGGLLRVAYAWMFESPVPGGKTIEENAFSAAQNLLNRPSRSQLPPQQSYPVSSYEAPATGNWRDTNDLEPRSVTENTTRLLENEELPQ
ncbi:MAG: zinc ribbon domain-containing protein [Acidobacteria bacterium]|nr:zinc ribbon domain-containing protein [Acidobacteriota bacterium]